MEQSKRRKQIKRSLERERVSFSKIAEASTQVTAMFQEWLDTVPLKGRTKHLEDQVQKATSHLIDEIYSGKTENVAVRFQRAVERITAAHLSKKNITFLQTLENMQQLLQASREWYQLTPRSKEQQGQALHRLHVLLREMEAGQVESIQELFRDAMDVQE